MKAFLFLCVSAVLIHVAILYDAYLNLKVFKHYPPKNPEDYMYMIVAVRKDALDSLYDALEDSHSSVRPTDDITIFVNKSWHPQNLNIPTESKDFSSPVVAKNSINSFIKDKTSGKIDNLVNNVNKKTATVIVSTNDALKVPSAGGTGWTKKLEGLYKMVVNTNMKVTAIEIPYTPYVSIILAIPDSGSEVKVGDQLIPQTIEALRKSMTLKNVRVDVTRATVYVGAYLLLDILPIAHGNVYRFVYGFKVSAKFP